MSKIKFIAIIIVAVLLIQTVFYAFADESLNDALNVSGGELNFENDSEYPWSECEMDGRLVAGSGNAAQDSSTSTLSLTVFLGEGQSIEFDWNVDCESYTTLIPRDYLVFSVNGEYLSQIHSTMADTPLGWQHYCWQASTEGVYLFEWIYVKDSSLSEGMDCGYVDEVEITGEAVVQPTPTPLPVPGEQFIIFSEDFSVQPDEWWNDDFDGDGNYWLWGTEFGHDAPGAVYSYSYLNWGGPLTPDNQLCTPEFSIPENISEATLEFWLYSIDDEYCFEHLDVLLVAIEENFFGGYDLIEIEDLDSITLSDGEWHKFTVDLSRFAGYEQVNIAFVHRSVTDQYGIVIDDVEISAVMSNDNQLPGDVNGDGQITNADALMVIRHGMGLIQLPDNVIPIADINSDGVVNIADAVAIMRLAMHL